MFGDDFYLKSVLYDHQYNFYNILRIVQRPLAEKYVKVGIPIDLQITPQSFWPTEGKEDQQTLCHNGQRKRCPKYSEINENTLLQICLKILLRIALSGACENVLKTKFEKRFNRFQMVQTMSEFILFHEFLTSSEKFLELTLSCS